MKQYKYSILFLLTLIFASCGQDLADLNTDPNTSPSARPQDALSGGQGYYAIGLEAYMNEKNALLAQYWAGGPGVALIDLERYFIEPADNNTEWSYSFSQSLSDLNFVIQNGNPARAGVAQLFSTMIYQDLVDLYGDIPYSEALKGAAEDGGILTPKYDDAKTIYADLIVKIDEALDLLAQGGDLGSEDLVYQGDIAKWVKFANSLKLRILMRQSIVDASVADQVRTLVANGNFISSTEDMATVAFNGEGGDWNPQYARREQGIGQFYVGSNTTIELLEQSSDPRLGALYDVAAGPGTFVGLDQGSIEDLGVVSDADFSFPSAVAYGASNDVILISSWEIMFLRAEADMRFQTSDDEVTMFNSAVSNHFDYVGAGDVSTYLAENANYTSELSMTVKSNILGTQKWIASNGLQETQGWIEARRFDSPESRLFHGQSGIFVTPSRTAIGAGVFPNIRLYPGSELSFNPNTSASRTLTDRVFWDN